MMTSNKTVRILTLFDGFKGSVAQILQRVVHYVDMLSSSEFIEKYKEPPKLPNDVNFKILHFFLKVDYHSNFLTDKFFFSDIFYDSINEIDATASINEIDKISADLVANPLDDTHSSICKLCYDSILPCQNPCTMLKTCTHTYCNECWVNYLKC